MGGDNKCLIIKFIKKHYLYKKNIMRIEISKQLSRLDMGVILSGSVAETSYVRKDSSKTLLFPIVLYVNKEAMGLKKSLMGGCQDFPKMRLIKECSDSEWIDMNDDAGSGELVAGWFKSAIDVAIGKGFTTKL